MLGLSFKCDFKHFLLKRLIDIHKNNPYLLAIVNSSCSDCFTLDFYLKVGKFQL